MQRESGGRRAAGRARLAARCALVVAAVSLLAAPVSAQLGVEFLTGVGYSSVSEGPTVLVGAELASRSTEGNFFAGFQETSVGFHISNVLAVQSQSNTVTYGIEGSWTRFRGPISIRVSGQAFARQLGTHTARVAGVTGTGSFGRIQARFGVDYVEGGQAAFPWFQKDLDGLLQQGGDVPFYRAHAGISASLLPASRLRWSQDVKWLRPAGEPGILGVSTGPELALGTSAVQAQAGIIFTEEGIEPLWQLRYQLLDSQSPVEFQLTVATQSLERLGPTVYGWLGYTGQSVGFGVALKVEQDESGAFKPSVYISFHPKF